MVGIEQGRKTPENERFLGLNTLETARGVVCLNPHVRQAQLLPYLHRLGASFTKPPITLTREEFFKSEVIKLAEASLEEGWDLALDSRARDAQGRIWHFPTMDLHPEEVPENTAKIIQILREFIVPDFGNGFLLTSGKSYQFLGKKLLTPEEWMRFFKTFSLINLDQEESTSLVVASRKYVRHCLEQGYGCLRVTANGEKKIVPRVIAVI